jgi:hypothetical protein
MALCVEFSEDRRRVIRNGRNVVCLGDWRMTRDVKKYSRGPRVCEIVQANRRRNGDFGGLKVWRGRNMGRKVEICNISICNK